MGLLPPSSSDTFLRLRPASSPLTDGAGTSEGHQTNHRSGNQSFADFGAARKNREQARREAGFFKDEREKKAAADGSLRIGLQDYRISKRKRRRHRAHGEHQRNIPGRDDAHYADRNAPGQA